MFWFILGAAIAYDSVPQYKSYKPSRVNLQPVPYCRPAPEFSSRAEICCERYDDKCLKLYFNKNEGNDESR